MGGFGSWATVSILEFRGARNLLTRNNMILLSKSVQNRIEHQLHVSCLSVQASAVFLAQGTGSTFDVLELGAMFPFDLSAPFPSELAFATENLNVFITSKFLFRGLGIRGSKSSFWLWLRLSEHKSFVECEVFFNSNSSQGCTLSPTHLPRFGREELFR